ncbi:centromeric protein e (cenp-e protein) [Ceraceosorus bombacis]|uniref:Centromeric protein e (Cenp-e protein) n=1 Tax=Ceraceosorus bombacis TaxID=401625 RepID=A0A0P1B9B5_9BASI|nr:centromeric protein e (cenp-e protein) [Ceraceosorus bombacis]
MFRAGLSPSRSTNADHSPFNTLRRSISSHSIDSDSAAPSTPTRKSARIAKGSKTSPDKSHSNNRPAGISSSPSKGKVAETRITGITATGSRSSSTFSLGDLQDGDSQSASTSATSAEMSDIELDDPAELSSGPGPSAAPAKQNVVVCVRMRPASNGQPVEPIWTLDAANQKICPTDQHPSLAKRAPSSAPQPSTSSSALMAASPSNNELDGSSTYDFCFDSLVTPEASTDVMYEQHISPLVTAAVQGYNGTVFAYGQTGSGKTHTMSGSKEEPGVISRAVDEVWRGVESDDSREFLLRVSYLEIYNETLRDLLAPLPARVKSGSLQDGSDDARPASPTKGGHTPSNAASGGALRIIEGPSRVQVVGLREDIVTSPEDVLSLLEAGQRHRHQAATDWNERSSRSHCVFTITIESRDKQVQGSEVRISQLNLIDLAGSERAASSQDRRKEGAFINKSLLTLGTVIAKLSEACEKDDGTGSNQAASQHIPYRDSKLTRLLQNSLGGNARVAVVCTLSPLKEHAVESLSTLKFGRRCKMVTTRARRGTVVDDKALLQRYRRELDKLRAKLEKSVSGVVSSAGAALDDSSVKDLESRREEAERDVAAAQKQKQELRGQVEHLTRLILTSKSIASDRELQQGPASMRESSTLLCAGNDTTPRRGPRRTDAGLMHRPSLLFLEDENSASNSPIAALPAGPRPFALEAELSSLRRELANAHSAKRDSETAHRVEMEQITARAKELEATNRALEEDLDAADAWCKQAKVDFSEAERREEQARMEAREAREANKILELVAKSKEARQQGPTEESELVRQLQQKHEAALAALREELTATHSKHVQELRAQRAQQEQTSVQRSAELTRELATEREALAVAQKELSDARLATLNENAERDFEQLVRGGAETVANAAPSTGSRAALERREKEVAAREAAVAEKAKEIETMRSNVRALPVPTSPSIASTAHQSARVRELEQSVIGMQQQTASLQSELDKSKTNVEQLQSQLDIVNRSTLTNTTTSSPPSSMKQLSVDDRATIVELQVQVEVQQSRIATLEKQLVEARVRGRRLSVATAAGTPIPGTPRKLADVGVDVHRSSPVLAEAALPQAPASPVRRYDRFGALQVTTLNTGSQALNRGGSLREYRRYAPTESPFVGRAGLASRFTASTAAGDLSAACASEATQREVAAAVRAEKEEIERLNAVIASQRAIMADLERSVAKWKERLIAQQSIIERLSKESAMDGDLEPTQVPRQGDKLGKPHLQEVTLNNGRKRLSSGSGAAVSSPFRERFSLTAPLHEGSPALRRTGSTISAYSRHNGSSSPYYGAHTFGRAPTGLGLLPSSPKKDASSASGWTHISGSGPEPLPLSDAQAAASSASRRKPRRTIENDLATLSSSPRVEAAKSKLLEPATCGHATPNGSPGKLHTPSLRSSATCRPTRDYYV